MLKQVIVVDESLLLPPGKLAAQVAHAALASFLLATPQTQRDWLDLGMPKVILGCASLAHIAHLESQAHQAGLPAALIRDAGRTVVPEGTVTCLGIGPASAASINAITRELRLLP
jgi:PTH2 family peptidyl-tRNA hydrolase